jgi:outer membrane protein TolC
MPTSFPEVESPLEVSEDQQISEALAQRPELRLLSLEQQKQRIEIQQASNLTLPSMTGVISASQDVGEPTSFKRDKSQAELEAGVLMDVPLQRREAVGKLQTARGKLAQLSAKLHLMQNTITAQVQTYRTALAASFNALEQAQLGAKLAEEMAEAERIRLERGDSDILTVNLREQAAFDAELLAIDAAEEYFSAKAQLDAATAAELVNPGMFLP